MDIGLFLADRFTIVDRLGQGGFGTIYLACDSNHRIYIVKAERTNKPFRSVKHEAAVYRALAPCFSHSSPVLGVPKVFYCGTHREGDVEHDFLVMEHMGPSLHNRRLDHGGTLTLKSVLMVGIQMLYILEGIHARGYIHRDIKPDNILTGLSSVDCSSLYLCDFGIAKCISYGTESESESEREWESESESESGSKLESESGLNLKSESGSNLESESESKLEPESEIAYEFPLGTLEFASRRALDGRQQGRCDDLESLLYTLVYLKKGSLPWNDLPPENEPSAADREMYFDALFKDLPLQMKRYFDYVNCLDVQAKPLYGFLRFLLVDALASAGMRNDGEFEWSPRSLFVNPSSEEEQENPEENEEETMNTEENEEEPTSTEETEERPENPEESKEEAVNVEETEEETENLEEKGEELKISEKTEEQQMIPVEKEQQPTIPEETEEQPINLEETEEENSYSVSTETGESNRLCHYCIPGRCSIC